MGACQAIQSEDLTNHLSKITSKALVLTGTKDISTPPELGKELATLLPYGNFKELNGVGHVPPLQSPDMIINILKEFLI